MAKKRIDSTALIEEFKEGSVFFRPSASKLPDEPTRAAVPEQPREEQPSPARVQPEPKQQLVVPPDPYVRTYARTPVRSITRYAYEVYRDQVETIKQMALEDKMRGGKMSMSEMVREALDDYIAKRTKT
jgi:hypothetical protein